MQFDKFYNYNFKYSHNTNYSQYHWYSLNYKNIPYNQREKVKNWDEWKNREYLNFSYSEYIHPVWKDEKFTDSFPEEGKQSYHYNQNHHYRFTHVCLNNPNLVSYTQNDDKGKRNIQTPIKVGKYLTKFYPQLTQKQIAYFVSKHIEKYCSHKDNLKLAKKPDEIIEVYANGPNSCMAGMECVEVYGAGDLAVAYIENKNKITARCVVWPDKKINSTIYGDADILKPTLILNGFENGDLDGAKLLKIESGGSYVMPYIDSSEEVTIGKDFLYIGDIGKHNYGGLVCCNNTSGYSGYMNTCDYCEEGIEEDNIHCLNDSSLCESCFDENSFYCESCCESSHNDNYGGCLNDSSYCEYCLNENAFYCNSCSEYHHNDDNKGEDINGDSVCESCAYSDYEESHCGDYLLNINDCDLCECNDCEEEREEEKELIKT